jgi:hypothetical protein
MNRPVPIPQIAGVPAQLTQTLNNRLMLMQQSAGTGTGTAAAARTTATTGAIGALALYANGTLGIEADAAPAVYLNAAIAPRSVAAYVKTAPTGAGIAATIYVGGTAWASFTIAAGATSATMTPTGVMAAAAQVRLAITGVGSAVPGSDLSVFVYY